MNAKYILEFEGRTQSLRAWAKEKNWRYLALYRRIFDYKWSVERALTEPLQNGRRKKLFEYEGKKQSLFDWAKEKNWHYTTIYRRITHCHWPIDRAMNEPPRKIGRGATTQIKNYQKN